MRKHLALRTCPPVRGCEVRHGLRIVYDRTDRIPRAGIAARWNCLGSTVHTWRDLWGVFAWSYLRWAWMGKPLAVRPWSCFTYGWLAVRNGRACRAGWAVGPGHYSPLAA